MYLATPKAYLFIYSDLVGTREKVQTTLDSMSSVNTWRYDLPNSFYVISSSTSQELANEFEQKLPTQGRFIFAEYNGFNSQGRLSDESWHLLNNKAHKPSTT